MRAETIGRERERDLCLSSHKISVLAFRLKLVLYLGRYKRFKNLIYTHFVLVKTINTEFRFRFGNTSV